MPEMTQVAVATIAAVAALIGSFLVWQSNRGNRATSTLDMALKQLNTRVTEQDKKITEQDKKITDLTKRLDSKDQQLGEQAREIRDLQDREQDREELLADYREHTLAYQLWLDDGGNPPIPKRSWRIRMDLEQEQHEKR